jgi:hypothetical protein
MATTESNMFEIIIGIFYRRLCKTSLSAIRQQQQFWT